MQHPLIFAADLVHQPRLGPLLLAEQDVRARSTGATYTPRQFIALLRLIAAVHAGYITEERIQS